MRRGKRRFDELTVWGNHGEGLEGIWRPRSGKWVLGQGGSRVGKGRYSGRAPRRNGNGKGNGLGEACLGVTVL